MHQHYNDTRKLRDALKTKKFGKVFKYSNYFDDYDFNFRYLHDDIKLLEIGIDRGGSLAMWREYFPKAQISAIDIRESCREFSKHGYKIHIGDQTDVQFLQRISEKDGPFDVIIDDGGHTMKQQILSFETLFPLLKEGGIYVIEDLHTSYQPEFIDQRKTAIEFLKDRIDDLNYWAPLHPRGKKFVWLRNKIKGLKHRLGVTSKPVHWEAPLPQTIYQKDIRYMYFADSIAFIYKKDMGPRSQAVIE